MTGSPAGAAPGQVVVAIATYRRPAMLAGLLPLVTDELASLGPGHRLVVVDNDPDESARSLVEDWAERGVEYAPEPRPGIAAARNRALTVADGAAAVVFVDDDEEPHRGWLRTLVDAWRQWGCAAVAGPVLSRFDSPVTDWVRECPQFRHRELPTGTVLPAAATGNLLLDLGVLHRLDLRFDDSYGLTGGSDSMLTRALARRGGEIRWCDEARVVETVPAERATRGWVLRRHVRTGNDWSRVHLELATARVARLRTRADLVARGLYRLALGALTTGRGLLTRDVALRAEGECHMATAVGVLRGAAGQVVTEYLRPAV